MREIKEAKEAKEGKGRKRKGREGKGRKNGQSEVGTGYTLEIRMCYLPISSIERKGEEPPTSSSEKAPPRSTPLPPLLDMPLGDFCLGFSFFSIFNIPGSPILLDVPKVSRDQWRGKGQALSYTSTQKRIKKVKERKNTNKYCFEATSKTNKHVQTCEIDGKYPS